MTISHIVAVSENNVIGKNNQLPWYMPADMEYFKNTTWGHYVIMGRKSYEAEGKALAGRTNIVITRNNHYYIPDGIVVQSIEEAFRIPEQKGENEIFIIGGGELYKQSLEITNKVYLTRIHTICEGDVFYPELDRKNWKIVKKEFHLNDQKNPFSYTYFIFERIG